jgi:eukaryotic-like serine/threonine-protein kinase
MPVHDERLIFNTARQIADPGERQRYLEGACENDSALLDRIHALLHVLEVDPEFLDATPSDPMVNRPGTMIGRYRLLELIGQGGMGEVWMAEQREPVKRLVAIKLIKSGRDSRQVLARFDAERQALALMDHPNIAKVLDAGESDCGLRSRLPYVVMELVKGKSIVQYCDEKRASLEERLALFVPVCLAIQHAHQKGVIHRDIKPNNILIGLYDGRPVPKVIDFGIAKATGLELTELTLHTNFGSVVGTPQYMSPEQAEVNQLDVDTRSDIYSLGVVLYELLTGTTPFEKATLAAAGLFEMLRLIREVDPPTPSTRLNTDHSLPSIAANRGIEPKHLTNIIRGELDWIVMKCLEKDRARRYASANGLARDIERFLGGEAVEAAPIGTRYRLRKFVQRYRTALMTVSAFAIVLVLGTGISIWQAVRATIAEKHAQDDREKAVTEKTRADREAASAKAVNDFLLRDLLGQADIANQKVGQTRDRNITVRDLLERAAAKVEDQFKNQPYEEAEVRQTLGNAYRAIAEYSDAEKHLKRALELHEQLFEPNHQKTVLTMCQLARVCYSQGNFAEAERLFKQALEARKSRNEPDDLEVLRTKSNLGLSYIARGRYAEAEALLSPAFDRFTDLVGPDHEETLECLYGMAVLNFSKAKYEEAEPMFLKVRVGFQKLLGADHPYALASAGSLGAVYVSKGRYAEAEKLFLEILPVKQEKFGPDHPETLHTMQNLAYLYHELKRYDDSESYYLKTVEGRRKRQGLDHRDTLQAMQNLAALYVDQGKAEEAEMLYQEVLKQQREKLGSDHPETIIVLQNLGGFYRNRRRYAEAEPLLIEAVAGSKKRLTINHPHTREAIAGLSALYNRMGKPEKAEAGLRELIEYLKSHPNTDPQVQANHYSNLTINLILQKKYIEAEPFARESWNLRRKQSPDRWSTFFAQMILGETLLAQKKSDAAVQQLNKGFEELKKQEVRIPSATRSHINDTIDRVIQLFKTQGNEGEAQRWQNQRLAIE